MKLTLPVVDRHAGSDNEVTAYRPRIRQCLHHLGRSQKPRVGHGVMVRAKCDQIGHRVGPSILPGRDVVGVNELVKPADHTSEPIPNLRLALSCWLGVPAHAAYFPASALLAALHGAINLMVLCSRWLGGEHFPTDPARGLEARIGWVPRAGVESSVFIPAIIGAKHSVFDCVGGARKHGAAMLACGVNLWPNRFKNAWEPVFHFSVSEKIKFRPESVSKESDGVFDYSKENSKATSGSGLLGHDGRNKREGMARPSNVVEVGAEVGQGDHAAPFPVALPEFFIKAFSDEGDIIFDPFMGSGTTLIAAEKNGRIAYGTEISPIYCDVIVTRWEQATGQKATRP